MTAEAFDRIARQTRARADELLRVARGLAKVQASTSSAIAGSATGKDREMLRRLESAAEHARCAGRAFQQASAAAERAAREARAQSARSAQAGRAAR